MRKSVIALTAIAAATFVTSGATPAWTQTVKITPLGSHDGEFCRYDRAMIFEDPDGTRILYDAGRTVRGPDDPRLGKIDGVLLSHVHGDHLGDIHPAAANAGTCGHPKMEVKGDFNSCVIFAIKLSYSLVRFSCLFRYFRRKDV